MGVASTASHGEEHADFAFSSRQGVIAVVFAGEDEAILFHPHSGDVLLSSSDAWEAWHSAGSMADAPEAVELDKILKRLGIAGT